MLTLCWICKVNPAETGEHWAKASIVRTYFGTFSQKEPIYHGRDWQPVGEVGGANSNALKLSKSICGECNGTLTAPYDAAWHQLYDYLHSHWTQIRRARKFYLHRVFPRREATGARHVQLYFAKLFGCYAYEQRCPIALDRLARCILNDAPCPDLVLGVSHDDQSEPGRKVMHVSPVHAYGENPSEADAAAWMCGVCPVTIKVFYRRAGSASIYRVIDQTWDARQRTKSVPVNARL